MNPDQRALRPPLPFSSQVAIVTGATGGIGQAVAARLLEKGAVVCLVGRTAESLETLVSSQKWPGERTRCYPVDLQDAGAVKRFAADCSSEFPHVHVLVHAAGTIALDSVRRGRVADFDRQLQVNVRAPYVITQALLPQILEGHGQIAFVNSSAGLQARREASQYAATKHALRALADSLREEVNEQGVRVLSVFLGRTASRMQEAVHLYEGRPYDPGKLLQPDDVASVIIGALELPRTAEVTDVSMRPLVKSY
jgi:NADP-dependent 3-hydroxy acid dehydrogenase YdfG